MQIPTHALYRPDGFDDERAPATVVVVPGGEAEAHWLGRGYTLDAPPAPEARAEKSAAKAPAKAEKGSK